MSEHIPEEILIQILARLPVKSLLKFRCVSKSWYSLITSPDFINTHLSLSLNNNTNKFLFFKHTVKNPLEKDECFFSLNHEDTLDVYACFEYVFKGYNSKEFKIVGSCNGLLCFFRFRDETIILWNPSIKKYVTLPTSSITGLTYGLTTCVVGFGFDKRANDYKVVRLVDEHRRGSNFFPPKVELYELSKGSWRGISCNAPPYVFSSDMSQAYINGVVHWVALGKSYGDSSLIVAFDMVNEIFREMALPDTSARVVDVLGNMSIGTFEESLVVCYLKRGRLYNQCSCSIWVMKEYGLSKSWVNQFDIIIWGLQNVQSLMKNGELLLGMPAGQLVLCNPKNQQRKDVEFYGLGTCSCYVDTYMESLILLEGRQTDSCNAVFSKREEDEIEEQQNPTILEEAKTTKKTRLTALRAVGSSKS